MHCVEYRWWRCPRVQKPTTTTFFIYTKTSTDQAQGSCSSQNKMAPRTKSAAVAAPLTEEQWIAQMVKDGLAQIEIDRQIRMKRNKEQMEKCGVLEAVDAVQKSM